MKIKLMLFILSFILSAKIMALDTTSVKFFPLHVGDKFTYRVTENGSFSSLYNMLVLRDSIVNNKRYFYCVNSPKFGNGWIRYDSTTGSLYKYDTANSCSRYFYEILIDRRIDQTSRVAKFTGSSDRILLSNISIFTSIVSIIN